MFATGSHEHRGGFIWSGSTKIPIRLGEDILPIAFVVFVNPMTHQTKKSRESFD